MIYDDLRFFRAAFFSSDRVSDEVHSRQIEEIETLRKKTQLLEIELARKTHEVEGLRRVLARRDEKHLKKSLPYGLPK